MSNRIVKLFGLSILATALIFLVQYNGLEERMNSEIEQGIRMAVNVLDTEAIKAVNTMIETKRPAKEILDSYEYQELHQSLHLITDSFPGDALWSYLMMPPVPIDFAVQRLAQGEAYNPEGQYGIFSVLTIDYNPLDQYTFPGVAFDYGPYPAMVDVFNGAPLAISGIVYDSTYETWNKAGFIRVFDLDSNEAVGILGVELEINYILGKMVSILIPSILAGVIIAAVILSYQERNQKPKKAK